MTSRYHVVILLLKGRKFPKRAKSFLVAEAKFDGNLVLSDPVDHLECPEFNEELAWDVDKRALQQHKLQRSSIKIQLYCENASGSSRDLIGYVLLDLRSAGESAKENLKWHSVLNTKYVKSKPEIQMSLYIDCHKSTSSIDDKSLMATKTGIGKLLNKLDKSLKPVLNPVTGIYHIGAEDADNQMFTLTFVVALALNLVQLIPSHSTLDTSFGFFFYFSLLGAEVTTQVFYDVVDPDFEAEQFSVKISSTLENLRTYFECQALEINFCCRGQILGSCQFPLGNLATPNLHEEPATIEGVYQIFPSRSLSQSRAAKVIPDELKPVIGASVTLKMMKPPAASAEENVVETRSEDVDVDVSNQVMRGILKKKLNSFNSATLSSDGQKVEGHLPPASQPVEDEAAVLEERHVVNGDSNNNRKSLFSNPTKSSKDVPAMKVISGKDLSSASSGTSNPNRSDSQMQTRFKDHHLEDVNQTHHFCFSIDLVNICHFKNPKPLHIFLKYFYEFFRSSEATMTDPVEVVQNSEVVLPNSLCYFDFAIDRKHLEDSLKSKPLLVEVWSLNVGQSRSSCIGIVNVDLSKVFRPEEGGDDSSSEGHWSGKLPVLSTERDSRQIGNLQVHLSFVDHGPVDVDVVIKTKQLQSTLTAKEPEKQVPNQVIDVRDSSEYKAAMELELWKKERMEELQAEMEEMKVRLEKDLENNFKKRDRERALLVSAEMEKYEKLNNELKKSLLDIEKREKLLMCNETELERRSLEMEREHERKMMDLREASKRSQDNCIHLIDMERKKLEAAEETMEKLKKQLSEGELRYQRLLKDFDARREKSKPETDFQAENNVLIREKFNLEKQLEAANRDAKLYKDQWMRALTAVQKFKERDVIMAKVALKKQQEEMEMLKMERVMKGEKEASDKLRSELDDVTKELRRFKEEQIISKKSPNKRRLAKVDYFSEEEDDDDDNAQNLNDSRSSDKDDLNQISSDHMVKEKNLLLKTGLYTEQDLRKLY